MLHVLAPPFVSRPPAESEVVRSQGKRRRSFLRKKREQPPLVPSQGLILLSIRRHSSSNTKLLWRYFLISLCPHSTQISLVIGVFLFYIILAGGRGGSEDVSVPKDIDLMALPQLCFPGIRYSLTCTHSHKFGSEIETFVF